MIFHCVAVPCLLIHLPIEGHPTCFWVWAFMNEAAIHSLCAGFCVAMFSTHLGIYLRLYDKNMCSFVRNCQTVFQIVYIILHFFKTFYSFIWQTEVTSRQRGRHRERGGGSRLPAEQRARCGARSQDPEIMTWAEGRGFNPLSHPGAPHFAFLL